MKNFISLFSLFWVVVTFSSCTKVISSDPAADSGMLYSVSVQVTDASTKATGLGNGGDAKVNSLQVFAFLNGNLDVYGTSQSNTLTLNCTQGTRKFYALVNAPALSSIKTEQELLATSSKLSNNSVTSLEMIGSTEYEVTKTKRSIGISVGRLASRVVVSKITKAFSSSALQSQDFKVKRIYLVNVSGEATYGAVATPLNWYNKLAYEQSLPASIAALVCDAPNAKVENSTSYSTVHTFYCYPNGTANDSNDIAQFTPRYTRLVIEASIGGDDNICYYPVSLPKIESNKSYNVSEIKITKPGSTSPDEPVSAMDCQITLTVTPWTEVDFKDGTTV